MRRSRQARASRPAARITARRIPSWAAARKYSSTNFVRPAVYFAKRRRRVPSLRGGVSGVVMHRSVLAVGLRR